MPLLSAWAEADRLRVRVAERRERHVDARPAKDAVEAFLYFAVADVVKLRGMIGQMGFQGGLWT